MLTGHTSEWIAAFAAAAGVALGSLALAQSTVITPGGTPETGKINLSEITGRDFAGQRIPAGVQVSDVVLRAQRTWAWPELGPTAEMGPDGILRGTQRMLLQGDVRLNIAGNRFTAAQAVVWVQSIGPSSRPPGSGPDAPGPDQRIRQIVVQFDRVSDPGAEAGFAHAADRLLVSAVVDGTLTLHSEVVVTGRPPDGSGLQFVRESEQRMARYIRGIAGLPENPEEIPAVLMPGVVSGDIRPGLSRPYEPNSPIPIDKVGTIPETAGGSSGPAEPLFASGGSVTFAVGTRSPANPPAPNFGEAAGNSEYIRLQRGEDDNTLLLSGGVVVQYSDYRKNRNLIITAERAVVFLPPGPLTQLAKFDKDSIRGIYLEGDVVATDGQYTLRGPRVFYDIAKNKAVMADAVFSTVDAKSGIPIYIRAKTLRQEAANQVTAESARLSTSAFFDPVFAVGARSISVSQPPPNKSAGGRNITYVDAQSLTLQAGGLPFFWLPRFRGEVDELPLQDVRFENSSGSGSAIKTTWNVFGLFGAKRPEGINLRALIDFYFERNFGLGLQSDWNRDGFNGKVFGYMLPDDTGTDVLSNGTRVQNDGEFRGIALAENRWDLTSSWALFGEFSSISDPTFVDAFFKDLGREGREITTDAYIRYIGGNSSFGALAKGTLIDFIPNQYLLQSQGYVVNRVPEFKYSRLADDLLSGVQPGLLTWSQQYSASRMRFAFDDTPASVYGFTTNAKAQQALGLNANQSKADFLTSIGYTQEEITRLDTRQELTTTLDFNPFKVVPFVVGRATWYDKPIEEFFGGAAPQDADADLRAWYATGVRVGTEITHVDDDIESSFLDIHRIRHVIQPSATAWTAGSTITQGSLPVYDQDVENINTGSAVRAGATQIWQTQRGGPGRWRSVDLLKVTTDFTFSSADVNDDSPIGRFDDARPEYSFLGNYFTAEGTWQASDIVGVTGGIIYDFDLNQPARTVAGLIFQHTPEMSVWAQLRYINALNSTLVDQGLTYQLTRKYSFGYALVYDADENNLQSINFNIRRRFREAVFGVKVQYDNIADETSVGIVFEPQLAAQEQQQQQRLRSLGRDVGQ